MFIIQTSSALLGTLYCLAKNPEKQEKLRQELLILLPEKDSVLCPEKLKNLPYLRAVMKEGLRKYSPAPANIRKTGQNLVLQGYQVPKDVSNLIKFNIMVVFTYYFFSVK